MKKSTKTFVISDETPNLFGFVTRTDGIDLSDFLENPVLLFNHNYDKVIGQWTDVRVEDGKLLGVPMFDESDPEAMLLYGKVEQGILKAASAGLTPIQFDEQKNVLDKSSLKEGTLTPVGANRKAITLSLYDTKGKALSGDVKEFLLSLQPTQADKPQNQIMKQSLINAMVMLCAAAGQTVALSATEDEFEAGLKAAGVKLSALTSQVTSLQAASKTAAEKELNDLLLSAVSDQRLTAEQVPAFRAFGESNIEQLKVTLSAMKPAVAKPVEQPRTPTTPPAVDPNDPTAKWNYDDFALKAPDELQKMQVADKARFDLLLSAKLKDANSKYSIGDTGMITA